MVTMTVTTVKQAGPFRYKGPENSRKLQAAIYRDLRRTSPAYARHVYKAGKELERIIAHSVLTTTNGGGLL